jgi:hypothetical protein
MGAVPDVQRPARLTHLDNLKVLLTAGVIVAHAAMTYGDVGTWVYEEPGLGDVAGAVLGAFVGIGVLFGLGLFFLMAGMLTSAPLARRGPRRFLLSRVGRLGLPLALYAVVVWPVLRWWIDRVTEHDSRSLVRYWTDEFSGTRWKSAGTGPLWFVLILLVVTVGWSLWRMVHPPAAPPEGTVLTVRYPVIAAVAVAVGTFVVRVWFPIDSPQFLDMHIWLWPQAAVLFVLGAVSTERGWQTGVPDDIRRRCRWALAVGAAVMMVLIVLSDGPDGFKGGFRWEAAGYAAFEGVVSVCLSLLVLDRFRRRHSRQGPRGRRLAGAAYGAFVVQGPVLVAVALAMRGIDLPGEVKFIVLAIVAVAACFGLAATPRRGRHGAP